MFLLTLRPEQVMVGGHDTLPRLKRRSCSTYFPSLRVNVH